MLIRRERPGDAAAIRSLHAAAFARPGVDPAPEAALVDRLREAGDVVRELSLVAEYDVDLIGHVVCSRAKVQDRPCLALGPIGVLPSHQRGGVGSALMHAVIAAADALGEQAIVLLGHPTYYPRFGFEPAVDHGIEPPKEWRRDVFMVRRLEAWDATLRGTFRYAPAFD